MDVGYAIEEGHLLQSPKALCTGAEGTRRKRALG
jgi:hypothetical protein